MAQDEPPAKHPDNKTHSKTREPGAGHLHLSASSSRAQFSSLSAAYPLKLLSPTPLPSQSPNLAVCYTLAYGGGLVGGDAISLKVDIDKGCGLVMLTQGSTKVFRHRPGLRPLSHHIVRRDDTKDQDITKQRLLVQLESDSILLLLPDSVSPFRDSRYSQTQRFVLPGDKSASILILDWVNSGRGYRPPGSSHTMTEDEEIWAMESYASTNEVIVGEKLVMRERMVLENTTSEAAGTLSDVSKRLAPYNVYATVLILGPQMQKLVRHLEALCDQTSQFQIPRPPGLIWSFSKTDTQGGILRAAAVEVEDLRVWLRGTFSDGGVKDLVGEGLWTRVI